MTYTRAKNLKNGMILDMSDVLTNSNIFDAHLDAVSRLHLECNYITVKNIDFDNDENIITLHGDTFTTQLDANDYIRVVYQPRRISGLPGFCRKSHNKESLSPIN